MISVYESRQCQPSLPALARLIDAAGFDLTLGCGGRRAAGGGCQARWAPGAPPPEDFVAAAAAHGVRNLRVFGSVARGEDRAGSDVDLIADFPPGLSPFSLGACRLTSKASSAINRIAVLRHVRSTLAVEVRRRWPGIG